MGNGTIGNRGINGQPILPYNSVLCYAGSDVFMDLVFVDHSQTPVVPATFTYQIDDISNDQNMVPATSPTVTLSTYTLQISGALMVMTYPYQGSQLCQISVTFTAVDSLTGTLFTAKNVAIIQLCAIQTPNGL